MSYIIRGVRLAADMLRVPPDEIDPVLKKRIEDINAHSIQGGGGGLRSTQVIGIIVQDWIDETNNG